MDKSILLHDNIDFLIKYLPNLIDGIHKEVDFLIRDMEDSAFNLLSQILEGFEWVIKSIASIERLGIIEGLEIDQLNELLNQIIHAFEIKDFVITSDILEYEIIPILEEWFKVISELQGVLIEV